MTERDQKDGNDSSIAQASWVKLTLLRNIHQHFESHSLPCEQLKLRIFPSLDSLVDLVEVDLFPAFISEHRYGHMRALVYCPVPQSQVTMSKP